MNSSKTNFRNLYLKTLAAWPYVIVSIILCVSCAVVINAFSENIYEVKTVLYSQESKNPLASSGVSLAFNLGKDNMLQNRVAVASSFTHNLEVAKKIGWEVSYFKKNKLVMHSELYKNAPYFIVFDKTHKQPISQYFDIIFERNHFTLKPRKAKDEYQVYNFETQQSEFVETLDFMDKPFAYNKWISSDVARFKIVPKEDNFERLEGHSFYFRSYESIARQMSRSISYEVEKQSNIFSLSTKGTIPKKLAD